MSLNLLPVLRMFLRFLGVIYFDRWVPNEGHNIYYKDSCLMNSQLTFPFLTYFILMNYGQIINALCETNLDDSIDSGNFSVRGYLPLIRKDSITHMHGLAVYVKEGLPFARDLSLENSADSYLCFRLALLHSVSYFFFLYWPPSSSFCTVFDSISSNIN